MDLSEAKGKVLNRHPWELSRTRCVLAELEKYLGDSDKNAVYINAGAGDLFFDRALLKKYRNTQVHAIDIAYKNTKSKNERIRRYHYLEEIEEETVDYALMMDSLEYMEDDVDYVQKMCARIKWGGISSLRCPRSRFCFPITMSI